MVQIGRLYVCFMSLLQWTMIIFPNVADRYVYTDDIQPFSFVYPQIYFPFNFLHQSFWCTIQVIGVHSL